MEKNSIIDLKVKNAKRGYQDEALGLSVSKTKQAQFE